LLTIRPLLPYTNSDRISEQWLNRETLTEHGRNNPVGEIVMAYKITRRGFLAGAAAAAVATGCATTAGKAPAYVKSKSPNEKLNIAGVGVGGKGQSDIAFCDTENVVALCDVDDQQAAKSFARFPNAKKYKDYRKMLEEMKEIDAITVSTPDHMHFPVAMLAMSMGKHVYVQKPLTHTVWEAREIAKAAKKYKVVTQMGNQGHSGDGVRELCEMIWSGAIGNVKEVHTWTDRPIWPQGMTELLPEKPVPDFVDWDLWQGVAKHRPFGGYHGNGEKFGYMPFVWRGWWEYGCGALGDMACHIMDPANWSLHLYKSAPTSVEVINQDGHNPLSAPKMSTLKYEFPAREGMPPVTLYWYDGNKPDGTPNLPPRPEGVAADVPLGDIKGGRNGSVFIGEKGIITSATYGEDARIVAGPKDLPKPAEKIKRIRYGEGSKLEDVDFQHRQEWIHAIKEGRPADGDIATYSGPFTEYVVLGNLALRANQKIEWDAKNMKITNIPEANQWVTKEYPKGWF
jgi:predicted dehydrogenase